MKGYYADIRVWFSVPDKHHDYASMDAANGFARHINDYADSASRYLSVFDVKAICNGIERCPTDDKDDADERP